MNRQNSSKFLLRGTCAVVIGLGLVACEEGGQNPFASKPKTEGATAQTVSDGKARFIEKETEAPEVFQKVEKALWDGRPSLGGVWVAHPSVGQPERVVIRNKTNGEFVIGALFNRDKTLPGPGFQLSADAAVAIKAPAGTPIDISVTALKVERTEIISKKEQKAKEQATKEADAPKTGDIEDIASTALDNTQTTADAATDTVKDAVPNAENADMAEKPAKKRKWWQSKKKEEKLEPNLDVEIAPIAPVGEGATAVASAAKDGRPKVRPTNIKEKPAVAAPATPKPAEKPAPSGPVRYVQLGLFSVEDNAKRTLANIKAKGIGGKIVTSSSQGKTFHRVIAGPAAGKAEQDKILNAVKGMGFVDAYLVKG